MPCASGRNASAKRLDSLLPFRYSAPASKTQIKEGDRMQTLTTYQAAAARNAEDLDTDRLLQNLMIAIGQLCKIESERDEAETKQLFMQRPSDEAAEAAIMAALFNVAALADRHGIDLSDRADQQIAKVELISRSGRLRMMQGGAE